MSTNATTFKGGRQYGVLDHRGAVIYEAVFSKRVADRLAEMESSENPPKDWDEAESRLIEEGLLK